MTTGHKDADPEGTGGRRTSRSTRAAGADWTGSHHGLAKPIVTAAAAVNPDSEAALEADKPKTEVGRSAVRPACPTLVFGLNETRGREL
jgi:hypothetical protein